MSLRRCNLLPHRNAQRRYLTALCTEGLQGGGLGDGKSGQRFFFPHDSRYLIKTLTKEELVFFTKSVLKDYHAYITTYAEISLLPRLVGSFENNVPYYCDAHPHHLLPHLTGSTASIAFAYPVPRLAGSSS